jgi:hypothetical protein
MDLLDLYHLVRLTGLHSQYTQLTNSPPRLSTIKIHKIHGQKNSFFIFFTIVLISVNILACLPATSSFYGIYRTGKSIKENWSWANCRRSSHGLMC